MKYMKEEILNELANKIIGHYPNKDNFTMYGSIHQQPYINDLVEIFKKVFNIKNLEHKYFMRWDNFNDELLDKIKELNCKVHEIILKEFQNKECIYVDISTMWNEWNFILEVIGVDKIDEINTEKYYKIS